MTVQIIKKPVIDYFAGTSWADKTYSGASGLHVINDTAAVDIVVTAGGFAMTLGAAGKELDEDFYNLDSVVVEPADGTKQVETIAVTAGATAAGTLVFRLTAAGLNNSPVDVNVPVTTSDNLTTEVATAIRTALAANTDIAAFATIGGTGANVVATARFATANDVTFAFSLEDADGTGVTVGASSNTTGGSAPSAIAFRAWVRG